MKKFVFVALAALAGFCAGGQTLEKMNWFNEPSSWNISGGALSMEVTPHTDYWRLTHYGFTVDDAQF